MKAVMKWMARLVTNRKSRPQTKQPARWTKAKSDELARLLATPDFFPVRINMQRNSAIFVQMSRESFRRSSFLDSRIVRARNVAFSADLKQLSPQLSRERDRPMHFILHGAFCGSTLLARYLEELPH